jgi:hypothetical protein
MLCAAVVGAVCLALDFALPLPPHLRMLIASPIALVAGLGSATLTKNGRDSLRSGIALVRGIRNGMH